MRLQLVYHTDPIGRVNNYNNIAVVDFLDFQKAFDTVYHDHVTQIFIHRS